MDDQSDGLVACLLVFETKIMNTIVLFFQFTCSKGITLLVYGSINLTNAWAYKHHSQDTEQLYHPKTLPRAISSPPTLNTWQSLICSPPP